MHNTSQKLAESQLALLRQSLCVFEHKGKLHISPTVQEILREAEEAYFNGNFDRVDHLAQVGSHAVRLSKQQFKKDPNRFIEKYKLLRETILINEPPVMKREELV